MKTHLAILFSVAACTAYAGKKPKPVVPYSSAKDKASYAIGLDMVSRIREAKMDTSLNFNAMIQGIKDGADTTLADQMTAQEAQSILMDFFKKQEEKRKSGESKQHEGNKVAGEKFLEANKTKPGIIVTASGAQYEVITQGTGPKPLASDMVKVHYTGTLIDGTVFDSSVQRGEPAEFPLNGVIRGWTELLQLMPVGSKYRLFLPYQLAYGEQAAGGSIKPFSTLIFEVELLEITTKK